MYRLLKVRCVTVHNKYAATLQSNLQPSSKVCSFCSFYHRKIRKSSVSYVQQRRQTTTINTALLDSPLPKKIKRKSKRYAELLEVMEDETSNRKASIKNLNADQLSILVDKPDISLDKLYEIRSQLNKVNNHKINEFEGSDIAKDIILLQEVGILDAPNLNKTSHDRDDDTSIMEDLQASGIADQAGIIKNSSFLQTLKDDVHKDDIEEEPCENIESLVKKKKRGKLAKTAKTVGSKTAEEISKETAEKVSDEVVEVVNEEVTRQYNELIKKSKEEGFAKYLLTYLQVCLSCGMISRAHHTLMHYRKSGIRFPNSNRIVDIAVYDTVMRAFAGSADIARIKEWWSVIKEDSIKPSPQTYASIFEALGRVHKPAKHTDFLNSVYVDMKENGITFDDVVKIPKYILDQRQFVMKIITFLQPDFQPTEVVPDYSYTCRLLHNINTTGPRIHPSPAEGLFSVNDLQERLSEQLRCELDGDIEIKSIEKTNELKPWVTFCRQIIANLEASWTQTALKAFERNLVALQNRERSTVNHSITLYPYLCVLDREEYIKVIIREIRKLADGSETFSPGLPSLHRALGERINDKYEIQEKQRNGIMEKTREVYSKYSEWYLNPKNATNSRIAWQGYAAETEKTGVSLDVANMEWPYNVRLQVGRFLYDIILKDIKIDINCIRRNAEKHYLPAFYTLFRPKGKRLKEEIKPHPILARLYRESQPETLTFPTSLVPSVCPPKPWYSIRSGGYIVAKADIIRVPMDSNHQWNRMEKCPPAQLWPALDSLNQLASIPWSVNQPILDVIIKVFQDGGSTKLNVPQPPTVLAPAPLLQPDSDEAERISVAKARVELRRRKAEMYSLWCDLLYRLSLANHFRNKIFWLPHNMDFRGRVYPIPPHLSHLGSDLARSLLVFAQGKPLGPNGLNWLKIHTINLTGFKKREPVSERIKYANENMDKILDSARNPLTGKMWWSTSDEPWQTLAACMEIAKALEAPDPEKYICHFPIHQDGSCNGLQHYAALGRDQIGAENVNLHPFETPQDVYSSVAAMVDERREKDAEAGVEIAKILKGFVARKVIKQTVMTTVYGVTKFGARLQIARQLKDLDDFPEEHVWAASIYLVQQTFESLRTMFESAREIQDWFTECARIISSTCSKNVEWVTPLGLPIVQPYTKRNKSGKFKEFADLSDNPNMMKQKNAFPPNFVHSLDSSHMMLTSLHSDNAGLTFMSVHDCYWTHACTVEKMNEICREQFVALHSEPILEDLSRFLVKKYCNDDFSLPNDDQQELNSWKLRRILSEVPTKGTFDLRGVLKSVYFFS